MEEQRQGEDAAATGARESYLDKKLQNAERVLALELDEAVKQALLTYLTELVRWNKAYNLVGRKTTWDGMVDHCVDSLSPLLLLEGLEGKAVMDLGAGAGFPGIPLYIAKGPFPLTLLDSTRKKVTFLRQVRALLGLGMVEVVAARAQDAAREAARKQAYDLVLMRAVADYRKGLPLAAPFLKSDGMVVALVGKEAAECMGQDRDGLARSGFELAKTRSTRRLTGRDTAVISLRRMVR
ncbi:MAG: 16S rRNA (guanine(527)-N(7))-methyltransferase RsmG [Candidatus Geothermincolia bacterium]